MNEEEKSVDCSKNIQASLLPRYGVVLDELNGLYHTVDRGDENSPARLPKEVREKMNKS